MDISTSIARQIASFVLAKSSFTGIDTDIFVNHQPDSPNLCVTVLDIPGADFVGRHRTKTRVQFLVRGDSSTAEQKALELWNIFKDDGASGNFPYTGTSVYFHSAIPDGMPFSIGLDEKHRTEWSLNVTLVCRRIPS